MRRIAIIAATAAVSLSLVGIAVGADLTKNEVDPSKQLDRLRAAQQVTSQAAAPAAVTAQQWDQVGDATVRLYGRNRYETAAAVSAFWWSYEDTFAVYLATGENFPDALSAGPSTFFLGPLLLVQRNVLPESTRAELERLGPCFIVAVGGAGTISDAVLLEADQYTTDDCFFEEE